MIMLAPLDEVKEFLEITGPQFDDMINHLIVRVSSSMESYVNRNLKLEQRTAYFNSNRRLMFLSAYPVDMAQTFTFLWDNVIQPVDKFWLYVWADVGKVEWFRQPLFVQPKEISITWSGGYEASCVTYDGTNQNILLAVPDDLKDACIMQTSYNFRRRRDIGVWSVRTNDGVVQNYRIRGGQWLPEVKSILDGYRKTPSEV